VKADGLGRIVLEQKAYRELPDLGRLVSCWLRLDDVSSFLGPARVVRDLCGTGGGRTAMGE
jgi:hypothetical protein